MSSNNQELSPRINKSEFEGGLNPREIIDPEYYNYLVPYKDYVTWGGRAVYHLILSINVPEKNVIVSISIGNENLSIHESFKLDILPGGSRNPFLSSKDYVRITRRIKANKILEILK